jgi:hypothetical protein
LTGQGFGDLRDWLLMIDSPAEQERFEALTKYWRKLESELKEHQGQILTIIEERLTGGEFTKHYLTGEGDNIHSCFPPPQPYPYVHSVTMGIIEGEMSFDFVKEQCFLPMNGYCVVEVAEPLKFETGRLALPRSLFGPPIAAGAAEFIGELFNNMSIGFHENDLLLVIGDAESKEKIGERAFTSSLIEWVEQAATILQAKMKAREHQLD